MAMRTAFCKADSTVEKALLSSYQLTYFRKWGHSEQGQKKSEDNGLEKTPKPKGAQDLLI